MRFFSLLLSVLLLSAVMSAQKKYLVSPNDEVIPVTPGSSASAIVNQWKERTASSQSGVCADKFYFGYDPTNFPITSNFGGYHRDVFGQWFAAKASGTIDTIFWQHFGAINAYDSTVYLRVHTSILGPDYGPGVRPGPFNPPCQNWGYWVNTNDLDQGVAAFIEDATDETWVSTIQNSAVPSGPPFAEERWGFGGFPVTASPGVILSAAMEDLGDTIGVETGETFFFSMRIAHGPGPNGGHLEQTDEGRTEVAATNRIVTTSDEDYPARLWKFYEHDKGPSNCAGAPIDSIRRGWVARGGFSADTLDVGMYNFWYLMTVNSNVPPAVISQTNLTNTFSTANQVVSAVLEDCNPANPGNAGVNTAVVRYSVDNVPQGDITMTDIGGDTWEAEIPGQPAGKTVTYRVVAVDLDGAIGNGPPGSYSIIPFGTQWYSIDTGLVCVSRDITSSGTEIDTSEFYTLPDPPFTGAGTAPKDDGTAGPIDMGGEFVLFGDEFRYAFVGINGAIALSKEATDTNDVNANGFATAAWTLPDDGVWGRRTDTVNQTLMPPMFIAPYWADHILGDSAGQYGHIYHGNAGDTCLFVVEWDSLGAFDDAGPIPDETRFRVVLNRCDGSVEFQYVNVGTVGLDSANLVGLQGDSNEVSGPVPGWVYLNRNGFPYETRIRNNYCVKFYPNVSSYAIDGWNMLGVSLTPNDADYSKASLFPSAVSQAFQYTTGYTPMDPLEKGVGVWVKFDGEGPVGASPSSLEPNVTATVQDKWNMISGPSGIVNVPGDITPGGTTVTSNYFGYGESGYYTASFLQPGRSYWVKVNGAGTLAMSSASAAPKAVPSVAGETELDRLNRVIISDATGHSQTLYLGDEGQVKTALSFFELPPAPPAGAYDVRYNSQRMLETYAPGKDYEYPISIQGAVYPVVVRWEISSPVDGNRKLILSDIVDGKTIQQVMEGSGAMMIRDANTKSVVIRLTDGVGVPAKFALSQNYPNPFNPVTHFTVDIPQATEVTVAIYDILGREIATLLSGVQAPGQYTMEWDGRDGNGMVVPTGMYFVRMSSEQFNAARKIMLMK